MRIVDIVRASLLAVVLAAAFPAHAQYPDHPIKAIVPFPAGGGTDVFARLVSDRLGKVLGQPVVIDNKGGADGNIGMEAAAKSPPDGYTILFNSSAATVNPALYTKLRFDPAKELRPVAVLCEYYNLVVVNAEKVPARTLAEFIELLRKNPGKYNFASAGMGSAPHLAMELWLRAAGVDLVHVPYQGSGPAMTDLVGGRVQAAMDNVAAMPLIKSGKLRALAITGSKRATALPDVPTFAEAGLAEFEVTGTWGLIAPAGVPADRVAILSDALAKAVQDPAVRETLVAQGIDPEAGTAAQYGATLVRESDKWAKLIDDAKIKL